MVVVTGEVHGAVNTYVQIRISSARQHIQHAINSNHTGSKLVSFVHVLVLQVDEVQMEFAGVLGVCQRPRDLPSVICAVYDVGIDNRKIYQSQECSTPKRHSTLQ